MTPESRSSNGSIFGDGSKNGAVAEIGDGISVFGDASPKTEMVHIVEINMLFIMIFRNVRGIFDKSCYQ